MDKKFHNEFFEKLSSPEPQSDPSKGVSINIQLGSPDTHKNLTSSNFTEKFFKVIKILFLNSIIYAVIKKIILPVIHEYADEKGWKFISIFSKQMNTLFEDYVEPIAQNITEFSKKFLDKVAQALVVSAQSLEVKSSTDFIVSNEGVQHNFFIFFLQWFSVYIALFFIFFVGASFAKVFAQKIMIFASSFLPSLVEKLAALWAFMSPKLAAFMALFAALSADMPETFFTEPTNENIRQDTENFQNQHSNTPIPVQIAADVIQNAGSPGEAYVSFSTHDVHH